MTLFICAAFEVGKKCKYLRGSLNSLLESMSLRSPDSSCSLMIAGLFCVVFLWYLNLLIREKKEEKKEEKKSSYGAFRMIKAVVP